MYYDIFQPMAPKCLINNFLKHWSWVQESFLKSHHARALPHTPGHISGRPKGEPSEGWALLTLHPWGAWHISPNPVPHCFLVSGQLHPHVFKQSPWDKLAQLSRLSWHSWNTAGAGSGDWGWMERALVQGVCTNKGLHLLPASKPVSTLEGPAHDIGNKGISCYDVCP